MGVSDDSPAPHLQHEYVRWRDVDPAGIMRYDAFVRMLELGEDELVRTAALPCWDGSGAIWLPRKVLQFEYHAPCRLGERLAIASYVSRVGTSALTLHADILSDDGRMLRAEGSMVVVAAPREGPMTKVPLPEALRAAVGPWTVAPPEARARAAERLSRRP